MSLHIGAKVGEVAETVLLPGDPLRAKFVAESLLENAVCYNEVRGMYGFTGDYQGRRVSVQGTGMGVPSISIYATELIREYGAETLIRVGTCGSVQESLHLKDVILAMTASTDSQINKLRFGGCDFCPPASFDLLQKAHRLAMAKGFAVQIGGILSTDRFYHDDPDYWRLWAENGILALEMEASALYSLAAQHGVRALAILTVSDDIVRGEMVSTEERQTSFVEMMELALGASAT